MKRCPEGHPASIQTRGHRPDNFFTPMPSFSHRTACICRFKTRNISMTISSASPLRRRRVESCLGSHPTCTTSRPWVANPYDMFADIVDFPIPPFPYKASWNGPPLFKMHTSRHGIMCLTWNNISVLFLCKMLKVTSEILYWMNMPTDDMNIMP